MIRPSYLRSTEDEKRLFEKASESLAYDPFSGTFFWKRRMSIRVSALSVAGCVSKSSAGYRKIGLNGENQIPAHRLAWFMFYGEVPKYCIDHIDGNRDNNSISNLRVVDELLNQQNRNCHRRGLPWGTSKIQGGKYYSARIHGKYLANFKTREEAAEYARQNMRPRMAWG